VAASRAVLKTRDKIIREIRQYFNSWGFLEVSTTELDDVVRLEDAYGRQGTSTP